MLQLGRNKYLVGSLAVDPKAGGGAEIPGAVLMKHVGFVLPRSSWRSRSTEPIKISIIILIGESV